MWLLSPIAFSSRPEWFIQSAEAMATFIEGIGIVVIVAGGIVALLLYPIDARKRSSDNVYQHLRRRLGRSILLGLEFLVAADIIDTVLISPTLTSVASLAIVVLIRTFLSWSMEMEVEGRWPWQKRGEERTK